MVKCLLKTEQLDLLRQLAKDNGIRLQDSMEGAMSVVTCAQKRIEETQTENPSSRKETPITQEEIPKTKERTPNTQEVTNNWRTISAYCNGYYRTITENKTRKSLHISTE